MPPWALVLGKTLDCIGLLARSLGGAVTARAGVIGYAVQASRVRNNLRSYAGILVTG